MIWKKTKYVWPIQYDFDLKLSSLFLFIGYFFSHFVFFLLLYTLLNINQIRLPTRKKFIHGYHTIDERFVFECDNKGNKEKGKETRIKEIEWIKCQKNAFFLDKTVFPSCQTSEMCFKIHKHSK